MILLFKNICLKLINLLILRQIFIEIILNVIDFKMNYFVDD